MTETDILSNKFFMENLLPPVRTTDGDLQPFNGKKIFKSLVKETNLSEKEAKEITGIVIKRIISSHIRWLSGPEIRELCCSRERITK